MAVRGSIGAVRPASGTRLFLLVAAVGVLTMPTMHRGAAELPHPHALFQFWCAADGDAFDDHVRTDDRSAPPPSAIRTDGDRPVATQASTPLEPATAISVAGTAPANPWRTGGDRRLPRWDPAHLAGRTVAPESPPPRFDPSA
jgi:hypothetical protein